MTRLFFFILAIAALVYMEPGADSLWFGWLLPAVAWLSLAYVFWLAGFVAILVGRLAWHYADFGSPAFVDGLLLPVLLGLSAIYLLYWCGAEFGVADAVSGEGGCDADGGGGCDGGG